MPTSSPRRTLTALGVAIGSFATLQSLLVPVLPVMQRDLGTDASGITWALTSWLITAAVATPLLGRVGDLAGRRRVFLIALAAVAAGSIVAALAPTLGVLIIGRVMQGLGAAIFPIGFGMVRDALPPARVSSGIGILSTIMAVGSGLGTVLSGPLAGVLGWRGLFLIPLIGVTVGAVLVMRGVPDVGQRATGRINIGAAVLLSGWLVALLLPLSTATTWGWGSPVVIGLFVLAAVLFAAWIVVELRSRQPLVDMRMMRLPGVWNTNLAAVLLGATMFGVWAYFARFLQEPSDTGYGLGATVGQAGLVMLPMLVLMAFAGLLVGPLSRVMSLRTQLAAGAGLIALSTAAIGLFHDSVGELAAAAALFGFGLGVAYAAMTNIVVQSVPATETGIASGMNANLRTVGAGIGTALMTAIVTGSASTAGGEPVESGYQVGFLVLAGIGAGAAILALLSRRTPARVAEIEPVVESPFVDAEAA